MDKLGLETARDKGTRVGTKSNGARRQRLRSDGRRGLDAHKTGSLGLLLERLVKPMVARGLGEWVKVARGGGAAAQDTSLESALAKLKAVGIGKCERRDWKVKLDQSRRIRDLDNTANGAKCAKDRGNGFGVGEKEGVL